MLSRVRVDGVPLRFALEPARVPQLVAAGASFADKIANAPMITDNCFFINNLLLGKVYHKKAL